MARSRVKPSLPKASSAPTAPIVSSPPSTASASPRGGRPEPDPEYVAQVHEARRQGLTIREIAAQLSISSTTVNSWLKRAEPTGIHRLPIFTEKPPPYALTRDRYSRELYERRRWQCARIYTCEEEWFTVYGPRQGACPSDCPGVKRSTV